MANAGNRNDLPIPASDPPAPRDLRPWQRIAVVNLEDIMTNSRRKKSTKQQRKTPKKHSVTRPLPAAQKSSPVVTKRRNTKIAAVVALLRRPEGASLETICGATDWQPHSVRGAIAGAIKKKMGLSVSSVKSDGVRTYRIAG